MITDVELRMNHEFVRAFETLRKRFGFREMSDNALREIASETGHRYESLRILRHLRNAIAHDEPVNRELLEQRLHDLQRMLGLEVPPPPPPAPRPLATEEPKNGAATRASNRAYRIHAWRDARLEQEMIANGFVSIGGEEIGDLTDVRDPEVIWQRLSATMTDRTRSAIALFVGYWRRFLWDAQVGDLVVLPTQDQAIAIGCFVGDYHYVAPAAPQARHRRAVSWDAIGVPRNALGDDLLRIVSGRHTVQDFKAPNAVDRLATIAVSGVDPGP